MRRSFLLNMLFIILSVLIVVTPTWAALRDAYVGDVLMIAWLEDKTVKVALANESFSRKSITLASPAWDQRWQSVVDRTVVVPARTVVVEAFPLSATWRGTTIEVEATAWERRAVVEVQTSEVFKPRSYLVRAQDDVEVQVDLGFLMDGPGSPNLTVDEFYRGWGITEPGRINIKSIDGGFRQGRQRNTIEFASPKMVLSMTAPRPRGESAVFSFSVYQQQDRGHWNYYQNEIPGPTLLVYSRNLDVKDNSHLALPQLPDWDWRSN